MAPVGRYFTYRHPGSPIPAVLLHSIFGAHPAAGGLRAVVYKSAHAQLGGDEARSHFYPDLPSPHKYYLAILPTAVSLAGSLAMILRIAIPISWVGWL